MIRRSRPHRIMGLQNLRARDIVVLVDWTGGPPHDDKDVVFPRRERRNPLAKHYALRDAVLEKSSYPNVFHFDSHM